VVGRVASAPGLVDREDVSWSDQWVNQRVPSADASVQQANTRGRVVIRCQLKAA
jgi:hypothetical protein